VDFDLNLNLNLNDSAIAASEHLGEHGNDRFEPLDAALVR